MLEGMRFLVMIDSREAPFEREGMLGRRGRGAIAENRWADDEVGESLPEVLVSWIPRGRGFFRADCTETRLSSRRKGGLSAKPLKLTTLDGLGVGGTEPSGVRNGSRVTSLGAPGLVRPERPCMKIAVEGVG